MKSLQRPRRLLFAALVGVGCFAAQAQEVPPGAFVETLLAIAKESNPEYASMRYEAQAALERVSPAGALPDPKFRAGHGISSATLTSKLTTEMPAP